MLATSFFLLIMSDHQLPISAIREPRELMETTGRRLIKGGFSMDNV